MSITKEKDPFWSENYRILFDTDRLIEFYPSADMTYHEKLNAISRFFIYSGITLLVYFRGPTWPLYIIITGLFLMYIMYRFRAKESYEPNELAQGYYEEPTKCTEPTRDNPFMNPTVNEIHDNPTRAAACDYTNPSVNSELEKHFNYNLYKDVDDLFNKNNSQRQFFTNPATTIPNDQGSFARWLYSTPPICKEDPAACRADYEDLRSNRKPVNNFDHTPDNLFGI